MYTCTVNSAYCIKVEFAKLNNRLSRSPIQLKLLYFILFLTPCRSNFLSKSKLFFSPNGFDLGRVDCIFTRLIKQAWKKNVLANLQFKNKHIMASKYCKEMVILNDHDTLQVSVLFCIFINPQNRFRNSNVINPISKVTI